MDRSSHYLCKTMINCQLGSLADKLQRHFNKNTERGKSAATDYANFTYLGVMIYGHQQLKCRLQNVNHSVHVSVCYILKKKLWLEEVGKSAISM